MIYDGLCAIMCEAIDKGCNYLGMYSAEELSALAEKFTPKAVLDLDTELKKKVEDFDNKLNNLYEDYKFDGCVEEAAGIGTVLDLWNKTMGY